MLRRARCLSKIAASQADVCAQLELGNGEERGPKERRPRYIFFVTAAKAFRLLFKSLFLFSALECSCDAEFEMPAACWSNFYFGLPKKKSKMLQQCERGFRNPSCQQGRGRAEVLKTSKGQWLCLNSSNILSTKWHQLSNAFPVSICWLWFVWLSASHTTLTFCE